MEAYKLVFVVGLHHEENNRGNECDVCQCASYVIRQTAPLGGGHYRRRNPRLPATWAGRGACRYFFATASAECHRVLRTAGYRQFASPQSSESGFLASQSRKLSEARDKGNDEEQTQRNLHKLTGMGFPRASRADSSCGDDPTQSP